MEHTTITYGEFLEACGEILFSLVAAPAVSSKAKEILDVHKAAKEKLAALLGTERGAARLAKIEKDGQDSTGSAPRKLILELELEILSQWGFDMDADTKAVESRVIMEERNEEKERKRAYRAWKVRKRRARRFEMKKKRQSKCSALN